MNESIPLGMTCFLSLKQTAPLSILERLIAPYSVFYFAYLSFELKHIKIKLWSQKDTFLEKSGNGTQTSQEPYQSE